MATTYWDYIRVEELLRLQGGLADEQGEPGNHELLFIVVHQAFELWFKLVLRELATLRDLLARDPVPEANVGEAAAGVDRVTRILRTSMGQFDVLESLNTRDYLDFRDKLFPASGFQSAQMREIEILLGLRDEERIGLGADGRYLRALEDPAGRSPSPARARVDARREDTPSLHEALGAWLARTPIRGSQPGEAGDEAAVDGFLGDYLEALEAAVAHTVATVVEAGAGAPGKVRARYDEELEQARAFLLCEDRRRRRVRAAVLFIESYRDLPLLAWPRLLLARLVEMEQTLIIFRQRHARMVERVIGRRAGTGGSTGVDYLDQTALAYRIFKDLWAVRTFQVPADALPPLDDPTPYAFRQAPAD
jgi:tryptophan 2,3-dioxygenase